MLNLITKDTIQNEIASRHIEFIELQYLLSNGAVCSVELNAYKETIQPDGRVTSVPLAWDDIKGTLDGSSVGFQAIEDSGLEVVTGPNPTVYIDNTDQSRLVIMGNTKHIGGDYNLKDPRYQIYLAEKLLVDQKLGLSAMRIGPEFEIFVFPKGVDPLTFLADNTDYHLSSAKNPNQRFMQDYVRALRASGIEPLFFHSEVASYQEEIGIECDIASLAADKVIILRETLKKLARIEEAQVSYEPKQLTAYGEPICKIGTDEPINGSGLHTNISFDSDRRDRKNAFVTYDAEGKAITNELSDDANLAIAGLENHMLGLQAFFNPSTISGARLGGACETPVAVVAGHNNRTSALRIVSVPEGKEGQTRVELRASDSMSCPHTLYAALLMAMVDAIKHGRAMSLEDRTKNGLIPKIVDKNIYKMSEKEKAALNIVNLHTGKDILIQSIRSLEADHAYLLCPNGPFGEHFHEVLEPYIKAILKADADRERCRKEAGKAWIKAQAETPAALEIARNVLLNEANLLKREELDLKCVELDLKRLELQLLANLQPNQVERELVSSSAGLGNKSGMNPHALFASSAAALERDGKKAANVSGEPSLTLDS